MQSLYQHAITPFDPALLDLMREAISMQSLRPIQPYLTKLIRPRSAQRSAQPTSGGPRVLFTLYHSRSRQLRAACWALYLSERHRHSTSARSVILPRPCTIRYLSSQWPVPLFCGDHPCIPRPAVGA